MLEEFAEAVFAYSFATMSLACCLPGGARSHRKTGVSPATGR